ncbi:MAG: ABC transporter permease [Candidatus Saccharimonas sp.]
MRLWVDHIEGAFQTLRRNRGRTLLTVTGITIGVASVTCILAISGGVTRMIGGQIEGYSGRLAVVRPGVQTHDPNIFANPVSQQSYSTSTLSEADVNALAALDDADAVVPIMTMTGTLQSPTDTVRNNVILGTTLDFPKVANISIKSGQFLDEATDASTTVIGEQLAINLFGTDQAVGQQLTVRGQKLTVIGVIKNVENPINYNNVDLNQAVIVNFERGTLFHQGRPQIQQINVLAHDASQLDTVVSDTRKLLLEQHLGEEDFTITSGHDISKPTNQLFVAVTNVMTAIAAISLVVGGVGVMNIMLVGVAERTREIGIRKAIGASNGMIVTQFLTEAMMMSLLGGFLGYVFGYLVAFIISTFLYFAPAFTWLSAVAALAMSVLVGLVFGLYPAYRASRKNTIEALRQYH